MNEKGEEGQILGLIEFVLGHIGIIKKKGERYNW